MKTTLALLLRPWRDDFASVAAELHRRNWAEANAGNLSIRLLTRGPGSLLLVKRAGARMRDIARNPDQGICLVQLDRQGRVCMVRPPDAMPTSELAAHLAVHRVLARHRPKDRAVLHTHPTALVALSLLVRPRKALVALLARMHSEGPVLIQGRLTAAPLYPPGSASLARATAAAVSHSSAVIWPGHGLVSVGPTLNSALDLVELVDKAATVALLLGRRIGTAGLSAAEVRAIQER